MLDVIFFNGITFMFYELGRVVRKKRRYYIYFLYYSVHATLVRASLAALLKQFSPYNNVVFRVSPKNI